MYKFVILIKPVLVTISNGVKHGCILDLVLFNLIITCMLSHAIRDLDLRMYLRYRLDGSLFNPHQLNGKTIWIMEKIVLEVLFTDDCALMAHKESDLQLIMNRFTEASTFLALPLASARQKYMYCSNQYPHPSPPPPSISKRVPYTFSVTCDWVIHGINLFYIRMNLNFDFFMNMKSCFKFPVMRVKAK